MKGEMKDAASIELYADLAVAEGGEVEWEPVITVHGFYDDDEIADQLIKCLQSSAPTPRRYRVRTIMIAKDHGLPPSTR